MNETILITGANRGIGLALTKLSLLKGLNVEACCRSMEKSDVLKKLSFQYSNLNIHEMDVTSSSSIERVSHEIKVEIDILVCNAGLNNGKGGLFSDDHDEKSIMDVMMVNVGGPFLTIKNLYNNLKKNNGSRVVIISSLMGSQTHSSSNAPIYRASKAAANNLMRTLSSELFEHGIAVASYHPGWVRTDMGGENA
ncbi:MAG: SDR family NAD(P)-dependent oxidoreductase, partial [Proteobacteria bacterium]|nr:SDR family NAD(P)-dependent oxidoreductase [Pseudomonadota bacterium]